jgi:hypothetical protein
MSIKCKRIAICGLVRDCKQALALNWEALQKLESEDRNIYWVFVENDSVDGSREWLDKLAISHPNVSVLGENLGELTIPLNNSDQVIPGFSIRRIAKMAFFRNLYLKHLQLNIGLENLDAVIIVDYDVHSLPIASLKKHLDRFDPHCIISALGTLYRRIWKTEFYDCYAYRELEVVTPQTYQEINSQRKNLWQKFHSMKQLYQVASNFNGCTIYPAISLENITYEVIKNEDPQIECFVEHVALHEQITRNGFSIFIDPEMRVKYETPFSYWKAWLSRRLRGTPISS